MNFGSNSGHDPNRPAGSLFVNTGLNDAVVGAPKVY
jgi:hypothetical protein